MASSQAIKFVNYTDRDFTWSFDGIAHTFKPNEPIYLEDYKAHHFAKHLIDRELNLMNKPTNPSAFRNELEKKCFINEAPVTPEVALNLNETKKEQEKKRGRPSKKVEEFPDLNSSVNTK